MALLYEVMIGFYVSDDKYRVRLLGSMDPSDYINASHIDVSYH